MYIFFFLSIISLFEGYLDLEIKILEIELFDILDKVKKNEDKIEKIDIKRYEYYLINEIKETNEIKLVKRVEK